MKQIYFLLLASMFFLVGCSGDQKTDATAAKTDKKPLVKAPANTTVGSNQDKVDEALILEYIKEKNLTAKKTASGIYYVIEKEGTDPIPPGSDVEVHYEGTLLNGSKFDSSYDRNKPAHFGLKQVIKGWTEGIPLLKNKGKGILIIPSKLGYGPIARGERIPANSVLVFKVEVLSHHAAHGHHGHSH